MFIFEIMNIESEEIMSDTREEIEERIEEIRSEVSRHIEWARDNAQEILEKIDQINENGTPSQIVESSDTALDQVGHTKDDLDEVYRLGEELKDLQEALKDLKEEAA